MLMIMSQGPGFQKTLSPKVMNLKVSGLGFSIVIYGIKTLQNQNRIFIYKSVILALGG